MNIKRIIFFIFISAVFSFGYCQNTWSVAKLFPIKMDGKWGYMDQTGKIIIKPAYDHVRVFFYGNVTIVRSKEKYFLIDENGNRIDTATYTGAENFGNGRIPVSKNGKWGCIDTTGKEVVPFVFDWISSFVDGFATTAKKGVGGFLDLKGNFCSLKKYKSVRYINEGFIKIGLDKPVNDLPACRLYDCRKKKIIGPTFGDISRVKNGMITCWEPGKMGGIFNCYTQKYCVAPQYEDISTVSNWDWTILPLADKDSLYIVKSKSKYGIINWNGKIVVPAELSYDYVYGFTEGKAIVRKGNNVEYTFQDNKTIIKETNNAKYGIMNYEGKLIADTIYDQTSLFSEGTATVVLKEKYGCVDNEGKLVIPCQYDFIGPFKNGLAPIISGGKKYDDLFSEKKSAKLGYIDKSGKIIWNFSN